MPNLSSSLPFSASDSTKPSQSQPFHFPQPLHPFSTFLHHHLSRLRSHIFSLLEDAKRHLSGHPARPLFAASAFHDSWQLKHAFDLGLLADFVAKTLAGTSVYTVSNSNEEFVLVSDPTSFRSLSLICLGQEDAEALLAQLKCVDRAKGFDGVPVFQFSFRKTLRELMMKVSRSSRGPGIAQCIMVGSLEDVLKKMEMNDKNSGWDDLIFIPPGKSYSQHLKEETA